MVASSHANLTAIILGPDFLRDQLKFAAQIVRCDAAVAIIGPITDIMFIGTPRDLNAPGSTGASRREQSWE
jgi:hypothetical protein